MDNLRKETNKFQLNMRNNRLQQRSARDTIIKAANFDLLHNTIIIDEILRELFQAELDEAREIRREMPLLVEGKLNIRKKNDKYYFSQVFNKREKGISKKPDIINSLARRKYSVYRANDIRQNLHVLEKLIKSYRRLAGDKGRRKAKAINRMIKAGIDPMHIFFTDEQVEWIDSTYSPNPYQASQLTYQTEGGIYVRSKLEATFGTSLEHRGIPYRYDDIVEIRGQTQNGELYEKIYFADFKIPNLRGGVSLLEIFGLMEDSSYADNALKRIHDYNRYKAVDSKEIFFAFDHDIMDRESLNSLINRMLFPI